MTLSLIGLLLTIPAAFITMALREKSRAHCSDRLGDPTPRKNGLLSGNPLKYIDPLGFIITLIFGFGWGNPTPTSPLYYKDRKKGVVITNLTPILVNLFTGLLAAALAQILLPVLQRLFAEGNFTIYYVLFWVREIIVMLSRVSVGTALFNLIPIYPLDGAKILQTFLSPNSAVKMTQNEKLLQVLLLVLMFFGIVGMIIHPVTALIVGRTPLPVRFPW